VDKSKRMEWEGHLAAWERRELHTGFWWAHKEDRDCIEDLGIDGRVTLKQWIVNPCRTNVENRVSS